MILRKLWDPLRSLLLASNALKLAPPTKAPFLPHTSPAQILFKKLPATNPWKQLHKDALTPLVDKNALFRYLTQRYPSFINSCFVPKPARIAAVNYAFAAGGRPHQQMRSLITGPLLYKTSFTKHAFNAQIGLRNFSSANVMKPMINAQVNVWTQCATKPFASLVHNGYGHWNIGEAGKEQQTLIIKPLNSKTVKEERKAFKLPSVAMAVSEVKVEQEEKQMEITQEPSSTITEIHPDPTCSTTIHLSFSLDSPASLISSNPQLLSSLDSISSTPHRNISSSLVSNFMDIAEFYHTYFQNIAWIMRKLMLCGDRIHYEVKISGNKLIISFPRTTRYQVEMLLKELEIDAMNKYFAWEVDYHEDEDELIYSPNDFETSEDEDYDMDFIVPSIESLVSPPETRSSSPVPSETGTENSHAELLSQSLPDKLGPEYFKGIQDFLDVIDELIEKSGDMGFAKKMKH